LVEGLPPKQWHSKQIPLLMPTYTHGQLSQQSIFSLLLKWKWKWMDDLSKMIYPSHDKGQWKNGGQYHYTLPGFVLWSRNSLLSNICF